MPTTIELMQARFAELTAEQDAVNARIAPLVAERQPLLEQVEILSAQIKDLTARIRADGDADLVRIARERSQLVKALDGKTGPS